MSDLTLFDLTGGYGVYQFVYASLAALVTALVCTDSALTPFLFHDISHRSVKFSAGSPKYLSVGGKNQFESRIIGSFSFPPPHTNINFMV